MRKMFLTAVALAPLMVATAAHAETVISNTRTTPIATATANNGSPDDIRIAENGTIDVASGVAVTVNSNNDVVNDGDIEMEDAADGATAIKVVGPVTGDVINNGTIAIDDGYTAEDDDDDDDIDGPIAEGTDRKGIWVDGNLTGDVINNGTISVEGNNSYGILIDGILTGDLINTDQISVRGDDTWAIRVVGAIDGDVDIGGSIAANGENATGVALEGDVSGSVVFSGGVTTTGFRYTVRPNDEFLENLDPDDLLLGGPAVWIAGDVAGGVLFDRTPDDLDPDEDDEDNDGVPDDEETTAQISTFGSAPAILVGSATETVTLGAVGTGDLNYGLVIKGNVSAAGIYDGVEATALQLGIVGGGAVDIANGIRLQQGIIGAAAFEADATMLLINGNVTAPAIYIDADVSASSVSEGDFDALGIVIEAGAVVNSIYTGDFLAATVLGETGDAYGIVDRSGTLSLVENTGVILAQHFATDDDDDDDDDNTDAADEVITGEAVAIDLSLNTTGATIRQAGTTDGDDSNDGVADADEDGDGVDDNDEPAIVGDIKFGSGADTLDIQNGNVDGDVSFGAGADTLTISGGGVLAGRISDSDDNLDVTIADGQLILGNVTQVKVSELNVGSDGNFVVTVDPANGTVSGFDVSGTATLADGAGFGVRFESLLTAPTRFTIIEAADLVAGNLDFTTLEGNTPFIYVATGVVDLANDAVYLDVRRRTAGEMGLIESEAALYDALYDQLDDSPILRSSFLSRLERDDFLQLYRQLMPSHSGGPLLSLTAGIDAVRFALSERRVQGEPGETTSWLQQINFRADKAKNQAYGFRSEGFGMAGGLERGGSMGTWGLSFAYTSSDLEDPSAILEENLTSQLFELGLYWRTGGDSWRVWARGAGGFALFNETREVITPTFLLRFNSDWSGYSASAGFGGSYDLRWGKWYGRAEGSLEYFYLFEEAHNERGGGTIGTPFRYRFDERKGHLAKGEVTLNIGRRFGEDGWLTPEIRLGWRQNFSSDLGVTVVRLGNSPIRSRLLPDQIEGGGPMFGFRLTAGSAMGFLGLEADAILLDEYEFYSFMLRAGYRF